MTSTFCCDYSDSSEVPAKVSLDLGDGVAEWHQFADVEPFLVACCFDVTARNATKVTQAVTLHSGEIAHAP
jgi:hypothetical protein